MTPDAGAGRGPRIALIHATPLAMRPIDQALEAGWPQARRMHLLDDSLSADLAEDGTLTPAMVGRFVALASYAKATGVGAILFTCSAFGPAIERAGEAVGLPTLKPNEAMFVQALAPGAAAPATPRRLALVATFEPSLASMRSELFALAAARGVDVRLDERHVPHAMAALARGDAAEHDRLVADAVAGLGACDAVMLAQFSMAAAAPAARRRSAAPVLTSPDCAVQALRSALAGRTP